MEESHWEPTDFEWLKSVLATRIGDPVSISWCDGRENRSATLSGFQVWGGGSFNLEFSNVT